MRAAAQVKRAQIGIREVVRQGTQLGQLHAPAPVTRGEVEDVDLERVTRVCSLNVQRAEQVVERVEVKGGLFDRVALAHLTVPRHQDVVVHDILRGDAQRGLQTVVPPVVDPLGVYLVFHTRLLSTSIARHSRVATGQTSTTAPSSATSIWEWRFAAAQ